MSDVVAQPTAASVAVSEDKKKTLHIKVYSPFKTYFDENAFSVTAINGTGPFDVLPMHHNFITLLNPCELIIERESGQIKIRIARGVMHVKADKVVVFLDV